MLCRTGYGDIFGVLVGDAFAALVVGFGIVGGPPVLEVSGVLELAALIIEAVNDLVTDDGTDASIVHGSVILLVEIWRLKDAGGEIDGVELGIVVGVDGGRCHAPLGAIDGLAD